MKFKINYNSKLPRLAWCAEIKMHSNTALINCGSWVEKINEGFIAGAWDGDFGKSRPDLAMTLVGSAAVCTNEGLLFCPASHPLECLQMVRIENCLYISNSLPLLLALTNDEPDPGYPDYYFIFLEALRSGPFAQPREIPTVKKRKVQMIMVRNLLVRYDLTIAFYEKESIPEPDNFQDYYQFLRHSVCKVADNAADDARQHPYSSSVTVSTGYDSTAAAVLAAQAGCRTGLSFVSSGKGKNWGEDSGKPVCDLLGMKTVEYARKELLNIQGLRDAEFYADPFSCGTDRCFLIMSDQLKGSLVMTGRGGESSWSKNALYNHDKLREPYARMISGVTLIEFSLRLGFLHFPIPYTGGINAVKLGKISRSEEMASWRIGGRYDRPLPRRIIEQAGIPREMFGQKKIGGSELYSGDLMSQKSIEDFELYLNKMGIEHQFNVDKKFNKLRRILHDFEINLRSRPMLGKITNALIGNRLHPRWRNKTSYAFQWGLTQMCSKYSTALKAEK